MVDTQAFGSTFTPATAPAWDDAPAPFSADIEEIDLDDADTLEDEASEGAGSARSRSGSRPAAKSLSKAQVRNIASKTVEVLEADTQTVAVAAGLLGCATGTVDVVTAIMTADRGSTQALRDITGTREEAKENMVGAIVALTALNRHQLKAMWTVLAAVDVLPATLPSKDQVLTTQLFGAIQGLDDASEARLTAAAALLRRS